MAIGNRVDGLEDDVEDLKATVQGLTEELVEAHERIRQIERALAGDPENAREAAREAASEVAGEIEEATARADQRDAVADGDSRIFTPPDEVARTAGEAVEAAGAVEADKREGADGRDEAERETDDIIVA